MCREGMPAWERGDGQKATLSGCWVGWLEGGVPLVWVQAGSETQGSGLKNARVSCVECQGLANLQCTRQGEAKWK